VTRRNDRRRRAREGFTLIEVMISLGIMTMGALAMLALQQQTIRSNSHARELSTAMQIAQLWVERFKQDASRWTQVGYFNTPGKPDAAAVLAPTVYLKQVATSPNVYQSMAPATVGTLNISNAFDFWGNDVAPTAAANVYYCAAFRPAWVYYGRAMRVDVRVWWAKEGIGRSITSDFPLCVGDPALLNPGGASKMTDYHVVYLPTVLRVVTVLR
jgi:prepilin-type N-terminal cleavage/methylation domain-containing protein